ncbi:MAG: S-layer homology domain-containing protein [Clostridiales bacterium]|nr:S-layer homology domain-containing protein [Clostridiales bacterium]
MYWAYDLGITTGTSTTAFSPTQGCTRAQFVTFLWRLAGEPTPTTASCSFTDLDTGEYYYSAVLWAVEQGVTNGTSATAFSPNDKISRAQAVTMLYRYAGSPSVAGLSNSFNDVPSGEYYYNAVLWAVKSGITNGTSATKFSPDDTCDRAMMVTYLYRYAVEPLTTA